MAHHSLWPTPYPSDLGTEPLSSLEDFSQLVFPKSSSGRQGIGLQNENIYLIFTSAGAALIKLQCLVEKMDLLTIL